MLPEVSDHLLGEAEGVVVALAGVVVGLNVHDALEGHHIHEVALAWGELLGGSYITDHEG